METVPISKELNLGQATHEGMSGKHNEDYLGVFIWKLDQRLIQQGNQTKIRRGDLQLGVVADGVGGQIAGEVASQMTVKAIQAYFDKQEHIDDVSAHLDEAIQSANKSVYEASQRNPAYRGMSTTVAVGALAGGRLYTAHVGDSRIYLLRDGRLRQVSIDHSWAQEAISAGLITPEEAKSHPNRHVIRRHLGGKFPVEVDHRLILAPGQPADEALANQGMSLLAGDTLLICSDGLTDMISKDAVLDSLQAHFNDLALAAQDLINKANQAGGRDNITVVIMQAPAERTTAAAATAGTGVAETLVAGQVKKTAAAAVTVSSPAVAGAAETADASGGRLRLILTGGVVLLIALALAIALFLVFGRAFGPDTMVEPSLTPIPSLEAPAVISTEEAGGTGSDAPTKERMMPATDLSPGTPEPLATGEPTEERTGRSRRARITHVGG